MSEFSRADIERALFTAAQGVEEGVPGAILLYLRVEAELARLDEIDAAKERARLYLTKHRQAARRARNSDQE